MSPFSSHPQALLKPLFDVEMKRLATQDQDQEVKEAAILGVGATVAGLADVLPQADVQQVRTVLAFSDTTALAFQTLPQVVTICNDFANMYYRTVGLHEVLKPKALKLTLNLVLIVVISRVAPCWCWCAFCRCC